MFFDRFRRTVTGRSADSGENWLLRSVVGSCQSIRQHSRRITDVGRRIHLLPPTTAAHLRRDCSFSLAFNNQTNLTCELMNNLTWFERISDWFCEFATDAGRVTAATVIERQRMRPLLGRCATVTRPTRHQPPESRGPTPGTRPRRSPITRNSLFSISASTSFGMWLGYLHATFRGSAVLIFSLRSIMSRLPRGTQSLLTSSGR